MAALLWSAQLVVVYKYNYISYHVVANIETANGSACGPDDPIFPSISPMC